MRFPRPFSFSLLALTVLTGLLSGCGKFFVNPSGGGGGGGNSGNYLYAANSTGNSVGGFSVGTGGVLTALNNGATFSVPAMPNAMAATPSGSFLYVGAADGGVYLYTINPNGSLVAANAPVASGFPPSSIAIDSTGAWLLTVDASSGGVSEFQINSSTGVLTPANPATVPFIGVGVPTQVYFAPSNQLVFVALQTGGVNIFSFNSTTGALTALRTLNPLATGNGDLAMRADPNTKFLFVAETGFNGVRALSIGTNGALTELAGSPYKTGLGPVALAMDSTGAFLYVANKGANNISGFSLGINGGLTALPSSPFTAGTTPVAMTLDQTGMFLAVVSTGGSPDLRVFSFDATTAGKLDGVASAATGTDPANAVAVASAK